MSLQELHTRALEDQVVNLTRDCHYLMSLLNTTDNIDWDSWERGRKIKEDLERSKEFFNTMRRRQERFDEYNKHQEERRRASEAAVLKQKRIENARRAVEIIKKREAEKKALEELRNQYTLGDGMRSIFDALNTFRFF